MGGTREPPIAVPKGCSGTRTRTNTIPYFTFEGCSGSAEDWCKAWGRTRLGNYLSRKRAAALVPLWGLSGLVVIGSVGVKLGKKGVRGGASGVRRDFPGAWGEA